MGGSRRLKKEGGKPENLRGINLKKLPENLSSGLPRGCCRKRSVKFHRAINHERHDMVEEISDSDERR
jgi:hypothetical protein